MCVHIDLTNTISQHNFLTTIVVNIVIKIHCYTEQKNVIPTALVRAKYEPYDICISGGFVSARCMACCQHIMRRQLH